MKKITLIITLIIALCGFSKAQKDYDYNYIDIINDYQNHLNKLGEDDFDAVLYLDSMFITPIGIFVQKINNNLSQSIGKMVFGNDCREIGFSLVEFITTWITHTGKFHIEYSKVEILLRIPLPEYDGTISELAWVKAPYVFKSQKLNCSGTDLILFWKGKIMWIEEYENSIFKDLHPTRK